MLNFVFYFKGNYNFYSTLYLDEILKFDSNDDCSIFFIENQNSINIDKLKSYSEKINFCSWSEFLRKCNKKDFYWLISEELKFTKFQFYDLLIKLNNNKPDVFYINPIIEKNNNSIEYDVISNDLNINYDKIDDLIFYSNSSYWIFSGELLPIIVGKFMSGFYTNLFSQSKIKILKSEQNLAITNLKFYLTHYLESNQLKYFLKHSPMVSGINKNDLSKFIFLILNLNLRIFYILFYRSPFFLIIALIKIDLGLIKSFFYKCCKRIVSIVSFNIKEKSTFILSLFYNLKFFILNYYSKVEISNEDNSSNIISLTTYRDRIKTVYIALESIWQQSIKPSKVVLVLSTDEFKNEDELPNSLRRLTKRGLEIRFVEQNVKSYKKLVYTYSGSNVITIDDDIIYPSWWFETFLKFAKTNPGVVLSYGCKRIVFTQYYTFMAYKTFNFITTNMSSKFNMPIGAYGVFYPKNILHSDLTNAELFLNLAANADDVWFKAMSLINNVESCQVFKDPPFFCHTLFSQSSALNKENYYLDMNDIYIWNVFSYYKNFVNDQCKQ